MLDEVRVNLSKKIDYTTNGIRCRCEIMNANKAKSCYILFNLWINVGDNEFDVVMKEFERKVNHYAIRVAKETFTANKILRVIPIVDYAKDSPLHRLKNKNIYVAVELTLFFENEIAFDRVNNKGINDLVFTYSQSMFNIMQEVNGLIISPSKK